MSIRRSRIRHIANSRSAFTERGTAEPPKASGIIVAMTLGIAALVLAAKLLTAVFAAA
ncbi:hypothetical protein [Mangrovicella endophytica]|uniref:hypothetical protein n=1 Tax=Mangrovicella endophytica TaxID=2066697 RepID=UPI0018E4C006|nr:hypothetical protein [Mangrovicella endophytica]